MIYLTTIMPVCSRRETLCTLLHLCQLQLLVTHEVGVYIENKDEVFKCCIANTYNLSST